MQNVETYSPANQAEWREWLVRNHLSASSVWLVFYKKKSKRHNFSWTEAVDEALCFGWVDSRRKPVDDEKFIQFFCQRKANSTWSRINKEKVTDLIARQQMMPAGLTCIHHARQNGSWNLLDEVEDLLVPPDLRTAFEQQPGALEYYTRLSNSVKKSLLQWVKLCSTDKTRQKRIAEIVNSAKLQTLPATIRR